MSRRTTAARSALVVSPLLVLGLVSVAQRLRWLPGAATRVDVGALVPDWLLLLGGSVSVFVLVGVWITAVGERSARAGLAGVRAAATQERRLLLSRLDHELKNPLMAMRAAAANAAAAAPHTPGLRSIEEQVIRLSRLTGDLRKIADIENGALDRRRVDFSALIEEAVEIVAEHNEGRSMRVDLPRAPWPLPEVVGDYDLLSLAVVNLLDNAVKYTPASGSIEVRARETGGRVVVEVADTGPGIAPQDLPSIWQELYRGEGARSIAGSGLGLPLVRAVIDRHGGTVDVQSRVGQGTAVQLSLPVATQPRAADGDAGTGPPTPARRSRAGNR